MVQIRDKLTCCEQRSDSVWNGLFFTSQRKVQESEIWKVQLLKYRLGLARTRITHNDDLIDLLGLKLDRTQCDPEFFGRVVSRDDGTHCDGHIPSVKAF